MEGPADHPGLTRILEDAALAAALDDLSQLPGSDLTTFMLELARRRAGQRTAADVVAQYQHDRFTAPAQIDPKRLAALAAHILESVGPEFTPVTLSPVVPLGTHHVLGGVSQNNVVTTTRNLEVAADPTNSLALEAAVRRRQILEGDPRSAELVRLAAVDRALRAQVFTGPLSFAHFALLGLVTAGRDTGSRNFEREAAAEHVGLLSKLMVQAGAAAVHVRISDFSGELGDVVAAVGSAVSTEQIAWEEWPGRWDGRSYYTDLCFKLFARTEADDEVELADGGLVDWTQQLVQSRKERLMISGLSLERLAVLG